MSLTTTEKAAARDELTANLQRSGLTRDQLAADLALTTAQLQAALNVTDPVLTWLLRDYLEREIRAIGHTPLPYSVLTDRARSAAEVWFDLRPLPERSRA